MTRREIKRIAWDLDGTIADLYAVNGWLDDLIAFNPRPYREAKPLYNVDELKEVLDALVKAGYELNIISWLSKNSTKEYNEKVRLAKHEWLEKYGLKKYFTHIRITDYGKKKATTMKIYGESILIDDEEKNRNDWTLGETINAKENILTELRKLI